ncbi:hypothetical protein T1E_5128 [Pseudomonas putida DOT-T1E]|uniref:Uncharacterized protein n=1 Tax=Pseudomonas putida (strain DOT-T1E) TaxID=1196325 RepID=I7C3H5_PSEPT|nr:hypothetical protein T1E_5128 [Pseudomonas putida DOT-T1E]
MHRATPGFGQQQPGAAALHGHRRAGCIERGRQAGPGPPALPLREALGR